MDCEYITVNRFRNKETGDKCYMELHVAIRKMSDMAACERQLVSDEFC